MDPTQSIADFCGVTGASDAAAREFLEASNFDVQQAAADYFAAMEDQDSVDTDVDEPEPEQSSSSAAPIGGATHSAKASSKSKAKAKPPKKNSKFSSLGDLKRSEEAEDDDSEKEQEYFAGGDKSALAVQDPNGGGKSAADHIKRLLNTARQNQGRPGSPPTGGGPSRSSAFTGAGITLGGDVAPSQPVRPASPAPHAQQPRRPDVEMVERALHLWSDGFSVDDGPLYRYDDPANARTLDMINRGSAPLDIMNVSQGQAVDVKLETHRNEPYVRPKKKYRPFGDGGQRLGSPTPGDPASSANETPAAPVHATTPAVAPSASNTPAPELDPSQPTVTLMIRMADGTRLPSRFNTTATVQDVYDFVSRSGSAGDGRAYTLVTTFPTKELSDKGLTLGEMAELKKGGAVVQKWS